MKKSWRVRHRFISALIVDRPLRTSLQALVQFQVHVELPMLSHEKFLFLSPEEDSTSPTEQSGKEPLSAGRFRFEERKGSIVRSVSSPSQLNFIPRSRSGSGGNSRKIETAFRSVGSHFSQQLEKLMKELHESNAFFYSLYKT